MVEPFFSGQPDSKHWEDYPANYTIAKAAKDQGGVVCYTHPANREEIPVGPHIAREFPIDLALGAADALDVLGNGVEEAGCLDRPAHPGRRRLAALLDRRAAGLSHRLIPEGPKILSGYNPKMKRTGENPQLCRRRRDSPAQPGGPCHSVGSGGPSRASRLGGIPSPPWRPLRLGVRLRN